MIDHREVTERSLEDGNLLTQLVAAHYSVVEQNVEQVSALRKAVTRKAHQVSEGARHITQPHADMTSFNCIVFGQICSILVDGSPVQVLIYPG
ncbi:hypothetical protein [Grimontia sp. NTOU-MAR1]|uniref:hypothetical protein n=1 Tax=Grimontia sp. NTOU-MAR1 TaxID=3111011 RepID=UPI002DBE7AD4|nr:hypothetical protein [Grimontia sp. NTOU-MAR1]WRV98799.1 hypothetical protein VP504_05060 [Grimontia sp. NTOU-MAR1]